MINNGMDKKNTEAFAIPCLFLKPKNKADTKSYYLTFNTRSFKQASILANCVLGTANDLVIMDGDGTIFTQE